MPIIDIFKFKYYIYYLRFLQNRELGSITFKKTENYNTFEFMYNFNKYKGIIT